MNAGCGSAPLADWPQSKAKAVRARQARNADATGAPLAAVRCFRRPLSALCTHSFATNLNRTSLTDALRCPLPPAAPACACRHRWRVLLVRRCHCAHCALCVCVPL